jgi:hypothetical protein
MTAILAPRAKAPPAREAKQREVLRCYEPVRSCFGFGGRKYEIFNGDLWPETGDLWLDAVARRLLRI